jgi:uncharacterized protein YabN with tetrapyrrole methylase and pyrophosphatase domain
MSESLEEAWRAAQELDVVMYDRSDLSKVLDKIIEELGELRDKTDRTNEIEEFGDIMFLMAGYARIRDIEPGYALMTATIKNRDKYKKQRR